MRTFILSTWFALSMFCTLRGEAQDFSNKGKDFWVGYGLHCRMFAGGGNSQDMVLYFATEAVTNVTVTMPLLGYTQTYNIPANTIFTSNPLPKTGTNDARLISEGTLDKGIHITSDKPIVAYAHIYNGNVSGATLLFPTNTLGKDYYSINFSQYSNEANSNCWFYAVAADTGTTTIEVTPSANTQTMTAGQTYTVNLAQGQVFNALATETLLGGGQTSGGDLTGSRIRSVSTGTGSCKRIAVFSGSGKINVKCPIGPSNNSADNYMVQAFPKTAWGQYFLTVPTQQMPNNYFRIAVSDPTAVVKLNGVQLFGLVNNFYYQFENNTPNVVESDKPITVAQYITSAGVCGNTAIGSNGDPEVIYLSPVEQNIDKVILNSTPNAAINSNWHYANIVIPNGGTALSSFKIDGVPIGTNPFVVHPFNAAYSYLVHNFSGPGQHTLQSDSGFNAIAYGYGNAESYGYNAGANVKDLYQFITIQNQYATVDFPAGCKNSPFHFSMTFPYQPTQIAWHFLGLFPDTTVNPPPNGYDSTWVVNGRQLFRYKLPSLYSVAVPGTYPIQVVATNPTPDGCGGEQEIDYDLQIFDQPIATFSFSNNGCVYDTVQFTGTASNTGGRPVNIWSWNFGDASTAAIQNPRHKYIAQGSYTVKFSLITDVGCLSDTASSVLQLTDQPLAKFGNTGLSCAGQQITFSDSSTVTAGAAITKWYWDFGDGGQSLLQNPTHTYNSPGSFTVTLKVETTTGCQSITFSKTIVIHAPPVASFNFGNACLPTGTAQFTDQSTISDGTQNLFTYSWNFGDGGTSAQQNPVHNYSATGPFNVVLTVTSNNGCIDDTTRVMNTIYPQPVADFTATPEVCNGTAVNINDQSSAPNNSVAQWVWNFGDATGSSQQNPPPHLYATAGSYNITLTVTSAAGCVSAVATKTIVVDALPTANFTASAPACVSRDINFTSTSVPNSGSITKWTWDFGDGTNTTLNNGTAFTHSYTAAGSYTVTLQVETDKGCVSTIFSKIISVNVLPKAGFISPEVCLTDPLAPFVDTSSVSPGSIVAWNWNFGDTNANAANPNTSAQQNPSHRYIAVGTYTATLVAISDKGCTDTIAQSFVVNGSIPVANFLVQNANALCSNRTVTITDASTVDFGSIVKQEIYWDYANDPTIKTVNDVPVAGQNYTHAYPPFTTPATKTVSVRMVSYSGITCLSVVTRTITLLATPAVEFDAVPGICADAPSFQITQAFITNGLPGTGTFSGTGVTPTGIFSPSVATAGSYTIHYVYNAANGCSDSKDQTIEVFPVPAVTAGPDRFALEGGSVDLLGSGSGNNVSYLWTPDLYIDDNTLARPKVSPPDDMFYTLTVTSADGCKASDEVFVKVLKKPVIPNIFSPNGDGIHDKWEIAYLATYPGCTIDIFNRYGQLVYHSIGYDKPWDGTINGKPAPMGTYYYIVDPKNGRQPISGYVDLIR